ncbi:MAG: branched-chain amino acid ABC transporter permease [Sulfolobales archaeon]
MIESDLIVKALAYASGIGIGAAAITLIYSTTRTFNFAHASMVAWGFYIVFTMTTFFGGSPYYYLPLAGLFSSLLGIILYLAVNRRLLERGASEVTLMMSTLGVDLIFFGFLNVYIDYIARLIAARNIPVNPFFFVLETKDFTIPYLNIRGAGLVGPLILVVGVLFLHLLLTRTKIGIAMRASIENPSLAASLGVNPYIIYLVAWILGGFMAGLSGGFLSLVETGNNYVGMLLIVSFFAGSIVGGLYSIFGSLLGGLLIGLSEYIGIYLLSIYLGGGILAYRPAIPLAVMVATLLIQPSGLAGVNWQGLYRKLREILR